MRIFNSQDLSKAVTGREHASLESPLTECIHVALKSGSHGVATQVRLHPLTVPHMVERKSDELQTVPSAAEYIRSEMVVSNVSRIPAQRKLALAVGLGSRAMLSRS